MRILCLHGHGTSASIFKSQTAAFRSKLNASFTFDFIDAPFACPPAPGVDVVFDSPANYTWWPEPSVRAIRAAHQWLLDYVAQHGPYDCVLGFSQGCLLVGSLLLYHARDTPHAPLPFRSAVFVCGGLPLSALEDLGLRVPPRAREINDRTARLLKQRAEALARFAAGVETIRPGVGLWDDTTGLEHDPERLPDPSDCFGLDFTTFPRDIRIGIPTVHVYGVKDPRCPASLQLAYFCDNRVMFDHGGGHEIPRSTLVSNRLADLVREVYEEADPRFRPA